MPEKKTPLRRRIAPSVPCLIEFTDEKGPFSQTFRLAFNLDALAAISEKTGLVALNFEIWQKFTASVLRAMFWGALLAYQPEFAGEEGFEAASSMLDGPNQLRAVEALWQAYLLYLPADEADLLRKSREEADGKNKPDPLPDPAPTKATPVIDWEDRAEPPDGSSSGPSADTISESPIAKSAG